jgi:hypothetical protein
MLAGDQPLALRMLPEVVPETQRGPGLAAAFGQGELWGTRGRDECLSGEGKAFLRAR